MSDVTARYGFALLCALLIVVIGLGAVWEIMRFRRDTAAAAVANGTAGAEHKPAAAPGAIAGGSMISLRQFRLRLLSALVWMAVLGALAYAVTILWPVNARAPALRAMPEAREQLRVFIAVVSGALCLMFVGFALLVSDMVQLARARRLQTARFHQNLADLARTEAARLRDTPAAPPVSSASPAPQAATGAAATGEAGADAAPPGQNPPETTATGSGMGKAGAGGDDG